LGVGVAASDPEWNDRDQCSRFVQWVACTRTDVVIELKPKIVVQSYKGSAMAVSAALDNRLASLDNRSASLDNRSASLDNRSASLDNRSAALDNRSAALDNRSAALDNRLAALDVHSAMIDLRREDKCSLGDR
jgi:uncharacterized protein (DUF3084 family)